MGLGWLGSLLQRTPSVRPCGGESLFPKKKHQKRYALIIRIQEERSNPIKSRFVLEKPERTYSQLWVKGYSEVAFLILSPHKGREKWSPIVSSEALVELARFDSDATADEIVQRAEGQEILITKDDCSCGHSPIQTGICHANKETPKLPQS
eukprot:3443386-Amphidinium_carterae.1